MGITIVSEFQRKQCAFQVECFSNVAWTNKEKHVLAGNKRFDSSHQEVFFMKLDKAFAILSLIYVILFCLIFWSNYAKLVSKSETK